MLRRHALITLALFTWGARAANLRGEIERGAYEASLRDGTRPLAAIALLRARFPAAADQTYLGQIARAAAAADGTPIKMKSFARVPGGYDVEAPGGRRFALRASLKSVTINGARLELGRGANAYLASVDSALKKTFVTEWLWRALAVVPAAYADSNRPLWYVIAAQTLSFFNVEIEPERVRASSVRAGTNTLAEWYLSLTHVCEREVGDQIPFDGSHTRRIQDQLNLKKALPPVEDCEAVLKNKIAPMFASPGKLNDISVDEARGACAKAAGLRRCFESYGGAAAVQPVNLKGEAGAQR